MNDSHSVRLVPTTVHGRYLVRPARAEAPAPLLVGFHGYGENASDHLAALERVPGADAWHLVAVQALHPFYKRDGSVVASWMTKLDREAAIADNVGYVERVVAAVQGELDVTGVVVFAGFSQGVAMAYRAAAALPASGLVA
jgi:poly(3-hydroxybutyrate) depolymerase